MVTPATGGVEQQIGETADILRAYAMLTWDAGAKI